MPKAPSLALDHLVVAARTLDEGAHWLRERAGVDAVPGGRHERMGTHNRLLGLADGIYLEIIAVDPDGAPPQRPRWFALDSPAMRARLAAGPALIHWVARVPDIEQARSRAPELVGEVLELERGEYRWLIGVPADGSLPQAGAFPTLIQWIGDRHPSGALPASGCRLGRLTIRAPGAKALGERLGRLGLAAQAPVAFAEGPGSALSAALESPGGLVLLPESAGGE